MKGRGCRGLVWRVSNECMCRFRYNAKQIRMRGCNETRAAQRSLYPSAIISAPHYFRQSLLLNSVMHRRRWLLEHQIGLVT